MFQVDILCRNIYIQHSFYRYSVSDSTRLLIEKFVLFLQKRFCFRKSFTKTTQLAWLVMHVCEKKNIVHIFAGQHYSACAAISYSLLPVFAGI